MSSIPSTTTTTTTTTAATSTSNNNNSSNDQSQSQYQNYDLGTGFGQNYTNPDTHYYDIQGNLVPVSGEVPVNTNYATGEDIDVGNRPFGLGGQTPEQIVAEQNAAMTAYQEQLAAQAEAESKYVNTLTTDTQDQSFQQSPQGIPQETTVTTEETTYSNYDPSSEGTYGDATTSGTYNDSSFSNQ